jgi:acyl dehydratase
VSPTPQTEVGTELPPLRLEPVSRSTLALFAGASGDHNPIHIDLDVAKSASLNDVIAHGMLSMAYLGRLLTNWVPRQRIRSYQVRFAVSPRARPADLHRGRGVGRGLPRHSRADRRTR